MTQQTHPSPTPIRSNKPGLTKRSLRLLLMALAATLALGTVACGEDDDGDADPDPTPDVVVDDEVCDDGEDNDEDGDTDCDDSDCDGDAACDDDPPPDEVCDDGEDNDEDGDTDCDDSDCDGDAACDDPPEDEVCDDGEDNDLDGDTDCDDSDCDANVGCQIARCQEICTEVSSCEELILACGADVAAQAETTCQTACEEDEDALAQILAVDGVPCETVVPIAIDAFGLSDVCIFEAEICDDEVDNDGDEATDCADDDCADAENCQEVCDSGEDEDLDGDIDCDDSDCTDNALCIEICDDGEDNDQDELVDCNDDDCADAENCQAELVCDDGEDDDGDELIDCDDPDCALDGACFELVCDDGEDNDGDEDIDCDDIDCADNEACVELVCDDNEDSDGDELTDCEDDDCALDVNCIDATACEEPPALDLVNGATGTLSGDENNFAGSCSRSAGPETVFTVTLDEPGTFCISTEESDFDTVLYVREGCLDDESEVACNDDDNRDGFSLQSALTLDAEAGTFFLFVDSFRGFGEGTGNFVVNVTEGPCTELLCDDELDDDGDELVDCADPDCEDAPNCQEVCDSGEDEDLDGDTDCADSDCFEDPACTETGDECSDELDNDGDELVDCDDDDCANEAVCRAELCDGLEAAEPGLNQGSNVESTDDFDPSCQSNNGADEAFTFTADADGTICVSTGGSTYDTVLAVLEDCLDGASEIACNDDAIGLQSELEFEGVAGTTYTIVVDAFSTRTGDFNLLIRNEPCDTPLPEEVCDSGEDEDFDGNVDCDDADCAQDLACIEDGVECSDELDNDGDELVDCDDPDCAQDPFCLGGLCDNLEAIDPGLNQGSNAESTDDFDPSCQGNNGADEAFSFTVDADTTVCIDTNGSAYDTVLAVFEDCLDAESEIACDDDGGDGTRSQLEFEAAAGTTYTIVVDAFGGGNGDFNLLIRNEPCDTPLPEEVCDSGEDEDFDGDIDCADADCADFVACQEICDNNEDEDQDGRIDCDDADCIEDPVCEGFECIELPSADFGTTEGNNVESIDNFSPSCQGNNGGDEAFEFTADADGTICVDTNGSGFDTVLAVLEDCLDAESEIACNDDGGDGTRSQLEFEAVGGTTYTIIVDAFGGGGGDFVLNISSGPCGAEAVQAIFTASCSGGFCHIDGDQAGGMNLDDFLEVIGSESSVQGLSLIEPGSADASYIVNKLEGTQGDVGGGGSNMPLGGDALSQDELDTIRDFIDGLDPLN